MKKFSVLLATNSVKAYQYLAPDDLNLKKGMIVKVPFRSRELFGVVWDESDEELEESKLKKIIEHYPQFIFSERKIKFIKFLSNYNYSNLGRALKLFIPQPYLLEKKKQNFKYEFNSKNYEKVKKTASRDKTREVFIDKKSLSKKEIVDQAGVSQSVIRDLIKKKCLVPIPFSQELNINLNNTSKVNLNNYQKKAKNKIIKSIKENIYNCFLIDGVTGSGKTEVYFEAVEESLNDGKQSLILLPEISLTTDLFKRIEKRFGIKPVMWHSNLSKGKRKEIWQDIFNGKSKLVIGARSSLFLPFKNLGLIIVDEEHDITYKQQEGIIYHARDMAISLGFQEMATVVLVSATPSLETIYNINEGKYSRLNLPKRVGKAKLPSIKFIDMRDEEYKSQEWISESLKLEIKKSLSNGEQALIFLNRRGYAPLTLCKKCGSRIECPKCDSYLVEHKYNFRLICHQCGFSIKPVKDCKSCNSKNSLIAYGPGIERVTEEIISYFPDSRVETLSSDNSLKSHQILSDMKNGLVDILVGTQIISKGHHFPSLTCVGVIDADLGMANGDLRAAERTYQLLHQVAGRAGREDRKGRAFLQTYFPNHPVIQSLIKGTRDEFIDTELSIREKNKLPPYGKLASIIISDKDESKIISFCKVLKRNIPLLKGVVVLGPAPASITKVRGRIRYRLLIKANKDINIQKFLHLWIDNLKKPSSIRMSIDIDPYYFL